MRGAGEVEAVARSLERMSTAADTPTDFLALLTSPEFRDDPYPFYAMLRAADPVARTPVGLWILTRHEDVSAVIRDPRLSNDTSKSELAEAFVPTNADDRLPPSLLFLDPPDHTRIRGLVSQAFTPRMVEELRPRVQAIVDELLDAIAARGRDEIDLVADFAYPLPVRVICEMLGIPPDDHEQFQEWSHLLAASIDPPMLIAPERLAAIRVAAEAFGEYFADLVARRRGHLGPDVLSALVAAEQEGDRLSEEELIVTGLLLLVAGHETTVNLIGNGTLALLRRPDEMERLHADPSRARNAVEEFLRYDSPVQLTGRTTVEPLEVGGVTVPPRQILLALLGAANRDPAAFMDPDRLDITRADARRHVSFGGGAHFCLGAPLARIEGEIAFRSLFTRFRALEPAGEPERRPTFTLRGVANLPVRVRP